MLSNAREESSIEAVTRILFSYSTLKVSKALIALASPCDSRVVRIEHRELVCTNLVAATCCEQLIELIGHGTSRRIARPQSFRVTARRNSPRFRRNSIGPENRFPILRQFDGPALFPRARDSLIHRVRFPSLLERLKGVYHRGPSTPRAPSGRFSLLKGAFVYGVSSSFVGTPRGRFYEGKSIATSTAALSSATPQNGNRVEPEEWP